ncbi:toll/interleukin-1 receptor domain-containing protein [Taibaiella chishuiensis]|uniref:TIR domain-containing protein n=1 Tax=Taibaiella chishuiensis TaxID=1434707 RepID=A0A2P8DDD7_9BACT|nr:toll/interleukin-1 receptor domain-containing protein [Taibaiella chishuiensis]PSK95226.1 TIR domain-containing protein [Taibaiella chishuiensis]
MLNDVFISYTQPDRHVACYMHDMLQHNGWVSWMALSSSHGISTGIPFESQVVEAIRNSRVFVLIYSDYCNRSADVIQEIRHRNKLHPTIIIRLDDSEYRADLSYHLRGIQHIQTDPDNLAPAADALSRDVQKVIKGANPEGIGSADSTDKILFKEGLAALRVKNYALAVEKFRRHKTIASSGADTLFYLSLATIGGRKIRKMDGLQVHALEDILSPAVPDKKGAGHASILLAIIKQDYYQGNGFRIPAPGIGELLAGAVLPPDKRDDLLCHLNEPQSQVWRELLHKQKHG